LAKNHRAYPEEGHEQRKGNQGGPEPLKNPAEWFNQETLPRGLSGIGGILGKRLLTWRLLAWRLLAVPLFQTIEYSYHGGNYIISALKKPSVGLRNGK